MRLSDAGALLIAEFEGFRPNLYNDAANNCTIGFGTLVHMGCINGSEPEEFLRGISRERGLEMLKQASDRFAKSSAQRRGVRGTSQNRPLSWTESS